MLGECFAMFCLADGRGGGYRGRTLSQPARDKGGREVVTRFGLKVVTDNDW